MITVRPGSHIHSLLRLLSAAGEIPVSALSILGNERVIKALVHRLESVRDLRFERDGAVRRVRLIRVSRTKKERTVRLCRKAIPILDGLYPGLSDWYMGAFRGHSFSGDRFHTERNHRVAEALAVCMAAGVEIRPYALPPLQKTVIRRIIPDEPSFYIARNFKNTDADGPNKTMYTRIVGALFFPGGCLAVYNTRNAAMKWSGRGEIKAAGNLLELARMNAGLDDASSALLFGASADAAMRTVLESDKSPRRDMRFDRIYTRVHFAPLNRDGVRLLKLLILPNRDERLLSALFDPGERSYNRGSAEYDATVGDMRVLSHLDGDIARLIRFRESQRCRTEPAAVLCFPWQTGFLKACLGELAELREIEPDAVETALGI